MDSIIDTWINMAVMFHDVLYGFRSCRGTRTAITDIKMSQELASINQDPLFLVFLNLCKSYDTLDRGRLF